MQHYLLDSFTAAIETLLVYQILNLINTMLLFSTNRNKLHAYTTA